VARPEGATRGSRRADQTSRTGEWIKSLDIFRLDVLLGVQFQTHEIPILRANEKLQRGSSRGIFVMRDYIRVVTGTNSQETITKAHRHHFPENATWLADENMQSPSSPSWWRRTTEILEGQDQGPPHIRRPAGWLVEALAGEKGWRRAVDVQTTARSPARWKITALGLEE
jgi:hypothetical protein